MASLLSGVLVLGAFGLFLALPGGRVNYSRLGWVILAAGAGTLIALGTQVAAGEPSLGWFLAYALVALFAAARVITHTKPVYSALYFVLLIVAVTAMLLLMQAEFLAAALVIVYGGAILVTYVFVIMLAQQSRPAPYDTKSYEPFWGCLCGFVMLTVLATQLFIGSDNGAPAAPRIDALGSTEVIGIRLFTEYVIGIQIAGLLLLAAMVGAIAIARRRVMSDAEDEGDE